MTKQHEAYEMINHVEFNDATHKLLSDNRESYFVQSARTKNGVRAEYQHGEKLNMESKECPKLGQQ